MDAIKIRPFDEHIEGVRPAQTLDIRGFVRGQALILAMLGREFALPARAIESDELGVYVLLDESERRLDFGAVLRVRHEYEPDMPPGGEIDLVFEQFSRERWEAAARAQGVDPSKVHLVVPPQRAVSVYFDSDGRIDGRGTLG
jgi:hypothetical protein